MLLLNFPFYQLLHFKLSELQNMHSINHFLSSRITEKKQLLEKLNQTILPLLPESCRSHITASNFNNQILTLIVDSPVWAARLRTQYKTIAKTLMNQLNLEVKSVKIKFQQPVKIKTKASKHLPSISSKSAELIRQTANDIDDEELRTTLLSLSNKANQ